jgi:hypothetical protein
MFKCFLNAATLMFADRKYWCNDRRDQDWEVIYPCLSDYNEKRRELFCTVLLILDESMSGWRPKTTKTGNLPSLTYEPRKPVSLGTQFKNGVECLEGSMAYQDLMQVSELQRRKEFFYQRDEEGNITNQMETMHLSGKNEFVLHIVPCFNLHFVLFRYRE